MEININLGWAQSSIIQSPARYKVAVCGRRFGKTYLAGVTLLQQSLQHPGSFSMMVAPVYRQLLDPKDGMWILLKKLIPPQVIKHISETQMTIELKHPNGRHLQGSVIQCRSGDAQQQDTLRGGGLDYLVLDEYADLDPQIWTMILSPRLRDTKGHALFIGTPKGYTHFYDLYRDATRKHNADGVKLEGWEAWQFTTLDGERVDDDEIAQARSMMSTTEFEQEFLAKFTSLKGRVYSDFTEKNYSADCVDDGQSPLYIGLDFNSVPVGLSVVVAQKSVGIKVLEAFHFQGTTPELITRLKEKFPNRKIICCPDPAGGQGNTTGTTDWDLLKSAGFEVKGKKHHVEIKNRVNNVNCNLSANDGTIRVYLHEKNCEPLVKTLVGLTIDEKTGLPSKVGGLDHMSDAFGYLLWEISNLFRARAEVFKWSPAA